MNFAKGIVNELRERKLWPVALVLLIALVAVPILLSKQAPTDLLMQKPLNLPPTSSGTKLPAISVTATPTASTLPGKSRNPFAPQKAATTTTTATTDTIPTTPTTSTPTAGSGASGTSTTSSSSTSGGTSSSSSSSAPTTSTTPAPAPKPAPAPAGLTDTQAYEVGLSVTNASGGVNLLSPLKRLTVVPSAQQPLLVELGVLQGGHDVMFAVQRGTVVSGPGSCTPGPIDCEILSLAPGQTEGLSKQTASGTVPVALFQVTGINAQDYPSADAAGQARRAASQAGRKLLNNSALNALSLFQYDPTVGAVVDLRTLTVGGS
jgi:hypothetical protein